MRQEEVGGFFKVFSFKKFSLVWKLAGGSFGGGAVGYGVCPVRGCWSENKTNNGGNEIGGRSFSGGAVGYAVCAARGCWSENKTSGMAERLTPAVRGSLLGLVAGLSGRSPAFCY